MYRAAATVALVALLGAGCSKANNGYTEDVRQTFLVSCTHREDEPQDFCMCLFEQIKQHTTFDRYVELDKEMQKDDKFVPDEYIPLAADCASRSSSSSSS